jgi:hypothetical protein
MFFVTAFLERAEEILDVASEAQRDVEQETAILIDRQGGIRMLDPTGWSLSGLLAEFGAAVVYRVKKSRGTVRVEGWDGRQKCDIQRSAPGAFTGLLPAPAYPRFAHPKMLQAVAVTMA